MSEKEKVDKAVELYNQGKFKEAIDAFSSVLETCQDNAELYNNIAKNFIIENDDDNEDEKNFVNETTVYKYIKDLKESNTEFKNIKNEKLFNLIILNDFFNLNLFIKQELIFIDSKQENFNSDDNKEYKISNNEDEDEDEDEDKYKIKIFIFTLINILINKLSNIETVENKKNLINELKNGTVSIEDVIKEITKTKKEVYI